MAAVFHELARVFPDTDERAMILKTAVSRAGDWVNNEIHVVPKWDDAAQRNRFSVLNENDQFRLSEWIDHAIAGIDSANLQQGSFFTSNSKRKVPGTVSFATPRELARLLFRIEQGRLVDEWSSLQMKKYMYLTKRRYRYSYAPELNQQAVYFESGSLYSCRPEEGFRCGKYMGNRQNLMNSVATVEGRQESDVRYIAVLMSNVLKFNSAWDHSRIAAATHELVKTRKPQALRETASEKEVAESGKSD